MTTETFTGPLTHSFADLRRAFGPSQAAFAERAGISQKQVSEIERAKTMPHGETVARIAQRLGLSETEVQVAIENTRQVMLDPHFQLTYRFQRAVADLYPRESEGERIDLSARLIGLGEQFLIAFTKDKDLRWFHVGQTAYDAYLALEHSGWQRDVDHAVSRAAFLAISRLVSDATRRYPQALEASDWERKALALVDAASAANANAIDVQITAVFDDLLHVATGDRERFIESALRFRKAAQQVLLRPARGGSELEPVQAQLHAAYDLVYGVREGLRSEADDAEQEIEEGPEARD